MNNRTKAKVFSTLICVMIIIAGISACGAIGFFLGFCFVAFVARELTTAFSEITIANPIAYLSMFVIGAIGWGFSTWSWKIVVATAAAMMFVSLFGKQATPHTAK